MKRGFLFLFMLAAIMVKAQNTSLTVIANPAGAPADLKTTELKSIFKGETQKWANNSKIVLALMKTHTPVGTLTCEKVCNMTPDEVTKYWLSQMIGGKGEPPSFFNTVGELQAFVAGKPGAIGIIDLSTPVTGLKIVTVEGKKSF